MLDKNIKIEFYFNDGDKISKGDKIAEISGRTSFILQGERTSLNFISHLSGIASKTNQFVQKAVLTRQIIELRNSIVNAFIIVNSAIHNTKSVGCHFIKE